MCIEVCARPILTSVRSFTSRHPELTIVVHWDYIVCAGIPLQQLENRCGFQFDLSASSFRLYILVLVDF